MKYLAFDINSAYRLHAYPVPVLNITRNFSSLLSKLLDSDLSINNSWFGLVTAKALGNFHRRILFVPKLGICGGREV